MQCISKNSKEFKYLANHYGVSNDQLALITYKYWSNKNSEDVFPSDIYIQNELGQIPYEESLAPVRELWERDYSKPQVFNTTEEAAAAQDKATRFFPSEAIVLYQDSEGRQVVSVRKPVSNVVTSLRDLFNSKSFNAQETEDFLSLLDAAKETVKSPEAIDNLKSEIKDLQAADVEAEIQAIKEKAQADGTFMKAPNGKPTNLNERQWLQVRTKNFKNWFGDWENDPQNASKVIDENGEPKVVYHGTLGEFTVFDFNRLGEITGRGSYTDHITGEEIPIDSSYAFFFTDNKNAARSYKNLAVWQQNTFRAQVYRNLQAIFSNNNLIFTKFEGNLRQEQRDFINNIVSPYIGFDVYREAGNIIQGKSTLTEEQKQLYAEKFKQIAGKIEKLPNAQSISNMANNLEEDKKNLQYLLNNKDSFISNKPLDYFKEHILHIASGYGRRDNGEVYLMIGREDGKYYVVGLPNTTGQVSITKDNFDSIINEFKKGVAQNEEDLANKETEGKYDTKGNVLEVFLNIKNPLEHDYNGSPFPDNYLVNAKEDDADASYYGGEDVLKRPLKIKGQRVPTAYIAARQVRKARNEGNDGVVYKNVRDPFEMNSYGIFGANQVKSATANSGEFSTENDNIQMAIDTNSSSTIGNASITNQLVEHLKSITDATGAQIFTSIDDINRYFKEHPNSNVQEATEEQKEIQTIKEKAIADGTFMKAPNGKDTNLTERQWLQVRTKNFINWFGDWINDPANASKVVDENGEPLVVYHHTDNQSLTEFSTDFENYFSKDGGTKEAIFFDENKTGTLDRKYDIPVFLNIRELNEYNETKQQLHDRGTTYREIVNQSAKKNNKDGGVHMKDFDDNRMEHQSIWIVHNPNQIKSATDNIGTFSTENDNIQMFIGKKTRTQFEQQLRKARPDLAENKQYILNGDVFYEYEGKWHEYGEMSQDAYNKYEKEGILEKQGNNYLLTEKGKQVAKLETGIDEVLNFLHSLEDNKENTAYIKTAIRWIANRSITLPRDHTKARQAFDLARKKNIDLQKYATLGELIASDEMKPKEKEKKAFNPDKAKTFSNKRTVTTEGGRTFTVYDVENTEEGQREVCKALAAHYEMSPWCLSTFTATGEPTESAKNYWNQYNALPRKIAYEHGKPVAFNSDSEQNDAEAVKGTLNGIEFIRAAKDLAYAWDEESITLEERTRLIKDGLAYEEYNRLYLTEKGISQADFGPNDPFERFNNPNREAWWDMEDRYPQDTLSDKIINEFNYNAREEGAVDEMMAEIADLHYPAFADANIQYLYDELNRYSNEYLSARLLDTNIEQEEREVIQYILNDREEHRDDEDYLPFFKTPQGEIYGFVGVDKNIYLDINKISPEHPIHEYTHLWDRALWARNPELWKKGVQLLKSDKLVIPGHSKSLWQEIEDSDNYGKAWKKKGVKGNQLESLIASEVHARLVGKEGAKLLDEIAEQSKSTANIIQQLKQWILEAWKSLKATFSDWSQEEIDKLTLEDFNNMVVRDFADGVNLNETKAQQVRQSSFDISKAEFYSGAAKGADSVWGAEARALGIKVKDYTPQDWDNLSQEWKDKLDAEYQEVVKILNRRPLDKNTYAGKLVRRDMMQADKADAVFAISTIDKNGLVNGGTAYAATRGILRGIPVYVFDQSDNQWKVWNNNSKSFVNTQEPTLTPHAATVGTREINDAGKQAIKSILTKTINQQQTTQQQSLPGPETKMDIWAGSNPQNADLSNIAKRPFKLQLFEGEEPIQFNSVEQAFQYTKFRLLSQFLGFEKTKPFLLSNQKLTGEDYKDNVSSPMHWVERGVKASQLRQGKRNTAVMLNAGDETYEETEEFINNHIAKILNAKDGWEAKRLGGKNGGFNIVGNSGATFLETIWSGGEIVAEDAMKAAMKASFEQNPQALQKLLATGNATLTHIKGGEWAKAMPELLMEVRDELRDQRPQATQQTQQSSGINKIADKTAAFGVEVSSDSRDFWNKVNNGWQTSNPNGIVAYRKHGDSPQSFSAETVNQGWIGNPFSTDQRGATTVQQFYDWLTTGNSFGNERATEEFRQAIIQKILATPEGSPILYYTELNRPSHATVIGYLINNKQLLQQQTSTETPVQEKKLTQQVSLPNYESEHNLYESLEVDPWKVNLLQELDEKLASDDEEVRKEAAEDIDRLLNASTIDEYNNPNMKQEEAVEEKLTQYEKIIQQFNNLLDSEIISASEIRHTAELIVNSISDMVTDLQTSKERAKQWFPDTDFGDFDFSTASRRDIIEKVGINYLIDRAKLLFDPRLHDYDDFDTKDQADLIMDNWEAIMTLASDIFAFNEGFGIKMDYSKGRFRTTEAVNNISYDNFDSYQDVDSTRETEGDEQEHWQIESRTIDVLTSMSELVRQGIHELYLLDKNGNKIMSKWDIPERVNPRQAVNSIMRWTQGALSLDDMIEKLSEKTERNPWVSQLIKRLSDKSGNETEFQSQFYGVMNKHYQLYSVVRYDNGRYYSMDVNSHPVLTDIMRNIEAQFNAESHPMFTSKGINATSLEDIRKYSGELTQIAEEIKHGEVLDEARTEKATKIISALTKIFGFPINEEIVEESITDNNIKTLANSLVFITKKLNDANTYITTNKNSKDFKEYKPFTFKADNAIDGDLQGFYGILAGPLEDNAVNAFYDSGKMYQSYVTPSFLTKLMKKFSQSYEEVQEFMAEEYGNSEWFRYKDGTWRNAILNSFEENPKTREIFEHKVELNFNSHNYMRNMTDNEYILSLLVEYNSGKKSDKDGTTAWYRVPMQSNKPSSEFFKFWADMDAGYKDRISTGFYDTFLQELDRIRTVRMRNRSKKDSDFIKNFDENGKKFCFLPVFNKYLEDTSGQDRLASLIQKRLNGETALTKEEDAELMELATAVIKNDMETIVASILNSWKNGGIVEAAQAVEGFGSDEAVVLSKLENFLWNDHYMAMNFLQLTVGDIAFYKDAEDLQKRLAQLHAPGTRANIYATDYGNPEKGVPAERVSDGKYRTFILKDFDTFKSNIIANITEVFDRKIARAPEWQKAQLKALKDDLVRPPKTYGEDDKGGKYWNINVTDAQAYSSPSSYRKKAFMFGKWSRRAEDIYQKLQKGEYNFTDLETAFQPLKPFVYTQLHKKIGAGESPIQNMNVPFQAKNSEYLLIMADAMIKGEVAQSGQLSRPNLLRAVYRVMEESERLKPRKGIDTVQFESAIKSGLQGKMDISQFMDIPNGEEAAYTFMMNQIFKDETDKEGNRIYKNYDTDSFVHETSYDDYCLQQEVPEHFKNHFQAHGSQERMIIPSDLDYYKNPNGDLNDKENKVYYEWTDPDGTKRKETADKFAQEYEETIADNIQTSLDNLAAELHLNGSKKEMNIALSEILQREILGSPRYGVDLIQACSIDKATGEFRIPKGDPIQAKRIEQLINSVIKNRVNKQTIAGGPIVQVSNFGTSRQLHIMFNARSGGLLLLEEEFTPNDKYKTYDEYKEAEQAGIAYFEVFAPIPSDEFYEKFAKADGSIDIEAIEAVDPELLKMVSYRIPTEDKYSCAPMKIVGFLPREAGEAIMLPYELTEIDDSDFDVDKRYVMRKVLNITVSKTKMQKHLIDVLLKNYSKNHELTREKKAELIDQVKMYMDNPERMRHADKLMEWLDAQYKDYEKSAYTTYTPKERYNDNKIIDMTMAVLTNEMTADKILNPGGFDKPKRMGYLVAAKRNPANKMSWETLNTMDTDALKKAGYIEKDLTWADTQVQFYHQNNAGSSLIGIFAVNKIAHAILERDDIMIDVNEEGMCGDKPFTVAGFTFGGHRDGTGNQLMTPRQYKELQEREEAFREMTYEEYIDLNAKPEFYGRMNVDATYDIEGNLIGKVLGSLVSASADTAKEPVLDLMNVNTTTVNILTSMLRLGMPFKKASLFLSQDIIKRLLAEFNKRNLNNYESLDSIIQEYIDKFNEKYGKDGESNIDSEELTEEELIEGIASGNHPEIDYKVITAFRKIKKIADVMRNPTFATRFNSISSAVGPLIIDNLITERKIEQFKDVNTENGVTHFYDSDGINVDIDDIFSNHPILKQFSRTLDVAKRLFSDMPAGNEGFRNLLKVLENARTSDTTSLFANKIYNDKDLLSSLSDFYQSYLLICGKDDKSGLINLEPKDIAYYINDFPKEFINKKYKSKYSDNALLQDINLATNSKTGRVYLKVNITGIDETQKEIYRNAWTDLHKADPELSKKLFIYNFLRGGIGFTPKTFMSLVPTYVKERFVNDDGVSYIDTYRVFPSVVPNIVIDQWVRNNWDDNTLVPWRGQKGSKYKYASDGTLHVWDKTDQDKLKGVPYMKIKTKIKGVNKTTLWRFQGIVGDEMVYTRIEPLGNNGEFLEMSPNYISKPAIQVNEVTDKEKNPMYKAQSPAENDANQPVEGLTSEDEKIRRKTQFIALLKAQIKGNEQNATNIYNRMRADVMNNEDMSRYGVLLRDTFNNSTEYKKKGIALNEKQAIDKFKEFC